MKRIWWPATSAVAKVLSAGDHHPEKPDWHNVSGVTRCTVLETNMSWASTVSSGEWVCIIQSSTDCWHFKCGFIPLPYPQPKPMQYVLGYKGHVH